MPPVPRALPQYVFWVFSQAFPAPPEITCGTRGKRVVLEVDAPGGLPAEVGTVTALFPPDAITLRFACHLALRHAAPVRAEVSLPAEPLPAPGQIITAVAEGLKKLWDSARDVLDLYCPGVADTGDSPPAAGESPWAWEAE